MKQIRRQFLAMVLSCGLVFATIPMTGCSTSWINTALQDLPVLVQIATSILSIVSAAQGNGTLPAAEAAQITSISNQVKSDLQLVQSLVTQFQTTGSTTLLGQIDAALTSVQSNLQAILTAAHIGNVALQTTITTSISLALTVVVAIQSLVPVSPTPAPAARVARVPMKPPKAADIKTDYNAILQANGFSAYAIS